MKSRTRIIGNWKAMDFHRRTATDIHAIATTVNLQVRGIIRYYSLYNVEAVKSLLTAA